jgi:flagellar basal body-associated protein FliL
MHIMPLCKKSNMSINLIVAAVIVLTILVVFVFIFVNTSSKTFEGLECVQRGGECKTTGNCGKNNIIVPHGCEGDFICCQEVPI